MLKIWCSIVLRSIVIILHLHKISNQLASNETMSRLFSSYICNLASVELVKHSAQNLQSVLHIGQSAVFIVTMVH